MFKFSQGQALHPEQREFCARATLPHVVLFTLRLTQFTLKIQYTIYHKHWCFVARGACNFNLMLWLFGMWCVVFSPSFSVSLAYSGCSLTFFYNLLTRGVLVVRACFMSHPLFATTNLLRRSCEDFPPVEHLVLFLEEMETFKEFWSDFFLKIVTLDWFKNSTNMKTEQ